MTQAMAIEYKFVRGQRVLSNDAKLSGGRAFSVCVIDGPFEPPGISYTAVVLNDDEKIIGMNWFYESELTLYCSDPTKGEKFLKQYEDGKYGS